jgi:hypothetical protein
MTIRQRAETEFQRMCRTFKARGVDSLEAYQKVMTSIDPTMDEQILYNAYRAEFTADDIKALTVFFKSPTGKHYLEAESKIQPARAGMIDAYVRRTVGSVISPMMKPVERRTTPGAARPGMPPAVVPNGAPPTERPSVGMPPPLPDTGGHR